MALHVSRASVHRPAAKGADRGMGALVLGVTWSQPHVLASMRALAQSAIWRAMRAPCVCQDPCST